MYAKMAVHLKKKLNVFFQKIETDLNGVSINWKTDILKMLTNRQYIDGDKNIRKK